MSFALINYNRIGDYSYGMYIYAFPVEQVGATLCKGCRPIERIAFSYPVTLFLAVLSWHFLEKRALSLRSIMLEWARRRVAFVRPFSVPSALRSRITPSL
jgi:peptidoglycan/LPS O-acetylase OafA/YrhL